MVLNFFICLLKWPVIIFLLTAGKVFSAPVQEDSARVYINRVREKLPAADSLTLHHAGKANEFALQTGNDSLISYTYYLKGMVYYYKGYFKASNQSYLRALHSGFAGRHPSFKSKLCNNIGVNYDVLTEYDKALDYYLRSLEIEKQLENQRGIAQSNINIGLVYLWEQDYEKAGRYLHAARTYFEEHPDTLSLGLIYQNLMLYEYHVRDTFVPEPVSKWRTKAESCFSAAGSPGGLIEVYFNMGKIYQLEKDTPRVSRWFRKALTVAERHEIFNSENVLRIWLATIKSGNINAGQAEKALLDGLELIRKNGIHSMEDTYYTELLKLYARTGETEKMERTLARFTKAINIHQTRARMETFEELSFMHDLRNKEQLIKIQQLRIEKQESRNFILILGILLVGFVSGGILFFFRFRMKKLKDLYHLNVASNRAGFGLQEQEKAPVVNPAEKDSLDLLFEKISQLLEEEALYTQFELSIALLAEKLNTNEKYVSRAINQGSGTNFYQYINGFRINHAKRLMQEDRFRQYSLEQIMYKVGFKSRTSFTAAFKRMTGLTPGQFRKMAREESGGHYTSGGVGI